MFCSNCGSEMAEGDNFCSRCGQDVKTGTKNKSPASTASTPINVHVKSFSAYKESKGKEWKSKVTKSCDEKKKKAESVMIFVSLMEWNNKEQKLKAKRGKKVPLRVSTTVGYGTLKNEAEQKWKNFHSDIYDENQQYHLLYEDGQQAVFIPGSKKEPFTLCRYKEELGKDFKQITLFLCSDFDFMTAEGLLDDQDLDFDDEFGSSSHIRNDHSPYINVSDDSFQNSKRAKRPRHQSAISVDLTPGQVENARCRIQDVSGKPNQIELDQQLATHLQEVYDTEDSAGHASSSTCTTSTSLSSTDSVSKNCSSSTITNSPPSTTVVAKHHGSTSSTYESSPPSTSSIVKALVARVMPSDKQLFIVVRRNAPLNRLLAIWRREVKKKSAHHVVRVKFSGEQGIDSGAMAMEFFTIILPIIGSSIFPGGKPIDSTSHIQNGNFKACGEIVATSIAQGGPAPCFLDESVYGLMVSPNVQLHELNAEMHLTATDKVLLESIRGNVVAHTDTIIEHGYTGIIDNAHIDEILQSIVISIVTKRLVCLREFMDGLDSYGLGNVLQIHPDVCKAFFVQGVQSDPVDANYLFSIIQPKFSESGSIRKEKEESMMDFLQDFLFHLEDTPDLGDVTCKDADLDVDEAVASGDVNDTERKDNANASSEEETTGATTVQGFARCDDANANSKDLDKERPLVPDYSPAGVMGWLTGQKHKPLDGKLLNITLVFDHDCLVHNPDHRICFPIVRACSKEVTFPVAHMETAEEFNKIFVGSL